MRERYYTFPALRLMQVLPGHALADSTEHVKQKVAAIEDGCNTRTSQHCPANTRNVILSLTLSLTGGKLGGGGGCATPVRVRTSNTHCAQAASGPPCPTPPHCQPGHDLCLTATLGPSASQWMRRLWAEAWHPEPGERLLPATS